MAIRDIVVGIDATTAGENRLRLALNLARDHKAYLAAAYSMAEYPVSASPVLAGVPVHPSPGLIVAPQVLITTGDAASDVLPQISREAERAEQMEHLFGNELKVEGTEGEWHVFFPEETLAFIGRAKSFDLTILGQLSPETGSSAFPPDETIVASGPVRVIPSAGTLDALAGGCL